MALLFYFVLATNYLSLCQAQCYQDSAISLTHNKTGPHYQEGTRGRPQCIGNYSVISETTMDGNEGDSSKGIKCSRKDSTSTNGYWRNDTNGVIVDCDNYNYSMNNAYCERGSGYVTLYTPEDKIGYTNPPTKFTCCIEGLCATIRLYNYDDFFYYHFDEITTAFPSEIIVDSSQLETCIIVPPSDITAIPQQYLVQMNTSVYPFSRISSLINCTDGDGITCGQSYYTLIDLNEERYQMTVPVTWSTDSTNNTDHVYSCRVRVGGLDDNHKDGHVADFKNKFTSIKASSAPSNVSYEVLNATAINVSWSISGDVNGFIINITSDGLGTVAIQLTDGSLREYVINGLFPERDYTVEVRGYFELLGPAKTTIARLYGISLIDSSLQSVSDDLSTQMIQVNCYSFGIHPDQVTWTIDSITPDSSYEPVNGSVLLDSTYQTYRHYITLTGSFTDGTTISCNANVTGGSISKDYTLRAPSSPPTGLSATILSSNSLSISWTPLSDVNGYIIQYTGGQHVIVNGEDSSNTVLEGLKYYINVYSYIDLLSTTYTNESVDIVFGTDIPSFIKQSTTAQSTSDSTSSCTSSCTSSSFINTSSISVNVIRNTITNILPLSASSTSSLYTSTSCTSFPPSRTDSNIMCSCTSSNGLVMGIITMGIIIVILIIIIVIQTVFIWRTRKTRSKSLNKKFEISTEESKYKLANTEAEGNNGIKDAGLVYDVPKPANCFHNQSITCGAGGNIAGKDTCESYVEMKPAETTEAIYMNLK